MYTQQQIDVIFEEICENVAKGQSLRAVLLDKNMPSSKTFFEWIKSSPEKVKQYAHACEARADNIFDEILEIADDSINDTFVDENENEKFNAEFVQRSRLRVDARKWILSKMNPKKYGDKLDHTTGGEKIIPVVINLGSGVDPNDEVTT